uniref:ARAD1D49038p n=1 Tax=Blastobotrys adeninivorans TaxID=409370 RepID=A0A060TDN0_BLAAD
MLGLRGSRITLKSVPVVLKSVLSRNYSSASRETVKALDSRKTYLVDTYTSLLRKNPIVLALHNNTLQKAENNNIRQQIEKAGGKMMVTRSNLFRVALRGLQHEDPASKEANKLYKKHKHPLEDLFYGPTCVIAFPELTPKGVEDVVKIVDKTNERLILLGGLIDGQVLNRAKVDDFKKLPTLDQLRADLAGILTVLGGAGLVRTLESTSNMLYLTMDERRKDMDKGTDGGQDSQQEQ